MEDIDFINIWIQLKFFMARVIHLPSTFRKIEAMCAQRWRFQLQDVFLSFSTCSEDIKVEA